MNVIRSSLLWKFTERIFSQGIFILVHIILARFLSPSDFGNYAIVMIFITFAGVLIYSGFPTALIQKQVVDHVDYNSVFTLSIIISSIFYISFYYFSPYIAFYYNNLDLILLIRIMSLNLFFGVFNSILNTYSSKNFLFSKVFKSNFISSVLSSLLGLFFAFSGFGIWSLVFMQLLNNFFSFIILLSLIKYKFILRISFKRLKVLVLFGYKLLLSNLLEAIYNDLRTFFISVTYSSSLLGFYNRGQIIPTVLSNSINGSIQAVLLPVLSSNQKDLFIIKNFLKKTIVYSSYVVFPFMFGLSVVAEELIVLLLTEKWLPSVIFFQIACFSFALWPIQTSNMQVVISLGRSDLYLKLELIKKIIGITIIVGSLQFGIVGIAFGQLISSFISTFIYTFSIRELLKYSIKTQLMDYLPPFFLSFFMLIVMLILGYIHLSPLLVSIIQIAGGFLFYITLSNFFKFKAFDYYLNIVKLIYNNILRKINAD